MTAVQVPVRPTDPPFLIHLAGTDYDTHLHYRRWVSGWRDSPHEQERILNENLHRTDAQGNICQRVVIEAEKRTANAFEPMALTNGAGWESMDQFRKHLLIYAVEQRRKEDAQAGRPLLSVGFYCGCIGNGMPGMIQNYMSDDILNLDNTQDLENFKRNWEPWIQCGVLSELWHDAGTMSIDRNDGNGKVKRWPDVKKLIHSQRKLFGLHGGTEAINYSANHGQWLPYDDVPMWCLSRYILQHDRENSLSWIAPTVPAELAVAGLFKIVLPSLWWI